MKKTIKLDRNSLRGLIKEAIEARQPGSPLFTPPAEKKRKVSESVVEDNGDLEGFLLGLADEWHSQFDDGDPSMSAAGQGSWEEQVDAAISELRTRITQSIERVEQKLTDGEFHTGGF